MPVKVGRSVLVSLQLFANSFKQTNRSILIESTDAVNYTVAAQLKTTDIELPFTKSESKKSPPMIILKNSRTLSALDSNSISKSPSMMITPLADKNRTGLLKRSISTSKDEKTNEKSAAQNGCGHIGEKVSVPRLDDDETFQKFFITAVSTAAGPDETDFVNFDDISKTERLPIQRKLVSGPKRRQRNAAKRHNPLKVLAARQDVQNEYTEIKTGIAEKELKRITLENRKLALSKQNILRQLYNNYIAGIF